MKGNQLFLSLSMLLTCAGLPSTTALAVDLPSTKEASSAPAHPTKLSWFIPDGVRAEPDLFTVFQWAMEGKLPNIKRMMEAGSYGYSIPVFPSHTPTNFAALLTGTYPDKNGVADGPMRIEGQTLERPAVAGFSSSARTTPAIWSQFAKGKRVVLLSLPGSTPPELKSNAITIRGRWGGWGADFHSVIFERQSPEQRKKLARNSRLFFQGMELTQYIAPDLVAKCAFASVDVPSPCVLMTLYGTPIFAKLTSSRGNRGYSAISISRDGTSEDGILGQGEWSKWLPLKVVFGGKQIGTNIKINLVTIGPGDFFRIRVLVDNLNSSIVEPPGVANELEQDLGPMVDFVDNFPPQLVYYPEDRDTFLAESKMSFVWHANSVDAIYKRYRPDFFIHDIYSPNQMLTSKWWMGYVDPKSARYGEIASAERQKRWDEVLEMYKQLDDIVGKALEHSDADTLVVLSSDHGAVPLDQVVQLNNLFAKKGWISYAINPDTGEHRIDWLKSRVVFLKMSNVYINPDGLGPTWRRGAGPAYEALRSEVIEAIASLRDDRGEAPLASAVRWEDSARVLHLPPNRVGDLVIANRAGFGWAEDITEDLQLFAKPLETGYKQAILAETEKGLWTPFIIAGRGIRKNYRIKEPISNIDQAPTILRALGMPVPDYVDGRPVDEIFE